MVGNWLKTGVLMSAILALFAILGFFIGGRSGMLIALIFGGGMNIFAYWNSDRIVLSLYDAEEVDAFSAPQLYAMVQELSARAGLPMPRVYIINEAQPNAFATGRNPEHAAVAATRGLLQLLSPRELRGVMAHELSHVLHRDTLISTVSATIAGAITSLANLAMFTGGGRDSEGRPANPLVSLLLMIVAPLAATLIQMAISRAREFEADRGGALISGDPNALADALLRIEAYARRIPMPTAEAHPTTAQLMISNPFAGGGVADLFRTHPQTEERVARLRAMRV